MASWGASEADRAVQLLVNKQGQTRVSQYYDEHQDVGERATNEAEIIRKCLARNENQVVCCCCVIRAKRSTLHSAHLWSTRTSSSCTGDMHHYIS